MAIDPADFTAAKVDRSWLTADEAAALIAAENPPAQVIPAKPSPAPPAKQNRATPEEWPELVPLGAPNLPRLDLQHLPTWAGDFARALAHRGPHQTLAIV